jgi:flagella basal body P-ring formation protein FlgA
MALAAVVLIAGWATSGMAAELRPMAVLSGPHVHLRDLFDDAGPNADRVLGPGPGPGGRIIVGAAQLAAIARQFGVDWRPASSGERAILEWPGRPLRREDALDAVRAALLSTGADPDCVIEMAGFTPPLVPLGSNPRPVVAQLDFNPTLGRFTAVLSVTAEGMDPITTRIGGQVDTLVELPVASFRLPAGTVLRARDLRLARVGSAQAKGEVLRDPAQAIGLQLKRAVMPNQPLLLSELTRPMVVARDSLVRIALDSRGLSLSGQGVALEAGAVGERIRVRNPSSRAVVEAEVTGPGQVRVTPEGGPLVLGALSGPRMQP